VSCDIDAGGIVNVAAKDKATNKEQAIRIQASGGLSEEEINKMVKDAEANAESDKQKKELVEARNHAESLVHEVEKNLKEYGDKVSSADKDAISKAVEETKACMDKEDIAELKAKTDALMQASMKLGEAMYKAQQATGGEPHGADTGSSSSEAPKDDNVVDADFEEVK
jgi:molecular chaperone DnaK